MNTHTAIVRVGEADFLTVNHDGVIHVVMRPCCETIGVDWSNELKRIKRDPILGQAVVDFTTPFGNGQLQTCLPLTHWHGWLFKLNLNTVAEEARPIVEMLQREGYLVLHDYWTKGFARNPRAMNPGIVQDAPRAASNRQMMWLWDRLKRSADSYERAFIYAILCRENEYHGLPVPSLDKIGTEAPPPVDLVARLFEGLDQLTILGVPWNHSRNPEVDAFVPAEINEKFKAAGIDFVIDNHFRDISRHPGSGITKKTVNSGLGNRILHCWVIRSRSQHQLDI